jgi:hypothetical protein
MEQEAARHGKTLRIFGAIWTLVGLAAGAGMSIGGVLGGVTALTAQAPFWAGIGVLASLLWLAGYLKQRAALGIFRDGVEAAATVVEVKQNFMVRVNGRHPWVVTYEYAAPTGETVRSNTSFWGERPEVEVGERVTVLHHAQMPSRSVIWTRLGAGQRKRIAVDEGDARFEAIEARLAALEARSGIEHGVAEAEAEAEVEEEPAPKKRSRRR